MHNTEESSPHRHLSGDTVCEENETMHPCVVLYPLIVHCVLTVRLHKLSQPSKVCPKYVVATRVSCQNLVKLRRGCNNERIISVHTQANPRISLYGYTKLTIIDETVSSLRNKDSTLFGSLCEIHRGDAKQKRACNSRVLHLIRSSMYVG